VVLVLISACSDATGTASSSGTPGKPSEDQVSTAVSDLAQRFGADPAEIEIVTSERVFWRDESLGCPQPGVQYTRHGVEGIRIVLKLDYAEAPAG
jgi:hypothetical protein